MKCWFIHTISVTLGWGVKIKHVSWEIAHLYIVPVQDCTCQGPVSVKPVCGVLSIKPPAAACNNLFMGSLCFRAPLKWCFKIQHTTTTKTKKMTSKDKLQQLGQYSYQEQEGQYFHQWCNIPIRRSNILMKAIFLSRQAVFLSIIQYEVQPYLENDVVGKRYAVEDFKSEILSTQAAWLSSRMRKYQGAWYLCQSK